MAKGLVGEQMKIICFEGLDGIGKTTLCHKLKGHLEKMGKRVEYLHEPFGHPELKGETGRAVIKEMSQLFKVQYPYMHFEDLEWEYLTSQRLQRTLLDAWQEDNDYDYVILDRGLLSTIVYQFTDIKVDRPQYVSLSQPIEDAKEFTGFKPYDALFVLNYGLEPTDKEDLNLHRLYRDAYRDFVNPWREWWLGDCEQNLLVEGAKAFELLEYCPEDRDMNFNRVLSCLKYLELV